MLESSSSHFARKSHVPGWGDKAALGAPLSIPGAVCKGSVDGDAMRLIGVIPLLLRPSASGTPTRREDVG